MTKYGERKKETEVRLVFAISGANAVVCADGFAFIIRKRYWSRERRRFKGAEAKKLEE